ncbi:hypothetical protein EXW56_01650 [Bacillus mycoides]|nr:hypothetical protein EXW56_01650 [Bacillus mycoides]
MQLIYTVYRESGDRTLQSCTSAIPKMDFAFGSKNHTNVNQVAPLAVGVSINPILIIKYTLLKNHFTKVCKVTSYTRNPNLV